MEKTLGGPLMEGREGEGRMMVGVPAAVLIWEGFCGGGLV